MNGEEAQRIALVAHGNAFLAGLLADPPELLGTRNPFSFVSSVEFELARPRELVAGTAQWYVGLQRRGIHRLRLAVTNPVRGPEGFGWSGGWQEFIEGGSETWLSRWESPRTMKDHGRVRYRLGEVTDPVRPALSVVEARTTLSAAIDAADAFGRRAGRSYAEEFAQARRALETDEPETLYYPGLLPEQGYSLEAHQLLAGVCRADVIRSWVDGPSEVEALDHYWPVTAQLQLALLDAALSAANAFSAS